MFDPGFRGRRVRGKEDTGTADAGSDPIGVLDRYAHVSDSVMSSSPGQLLYTLDFTQ